MEQMVNIPIKVPANKIKFLMSIIQNLSENMQFDVQIKKDIASKNEDFEKLKSFSGCLNGDFKDISVEQMRINKALRKWEKFL